MKNPHFLLFFAVFGALFGQSDTQPPQLAGVSITPPSVDVSVSGRAVTLTAHVTDNLSGVTPALNAVLRSPSGRRLVLRQPASPPFYVLDGNITAGNTMPIYSEAGTWTIESLSFQDRAGNVTTMASAALAAAGFTASLQVIDANPDSALPQVTGIGLTPASVDVSAGAATVTVTLNLSDDLAGIDPSANGTADFELRSPSGKQSRVLGSASFSLQSGTLTNGVWQAALPMPAYSEPGIWTVAALTIRDRAGASRYYDATALAAAGAAAQMIVNASTADTQAPKLSSVAFTPVVVNPAAGAESVVVTLGVTDDLAGVSFAPDAGIGAPGVWMGATFQSPSGAQKRDTDFERIEKAPVSGTTLNGLWELTATIPPFSEEGTWKLSSLRLRDGTRNLAVLATAAEIAAAGFPTDLVVIQPSLRTDGTVGSGGGTVMDNAFGARAQITAPAGILAGATDVAIDVLQSPLGFPLPAGFSTAETYFVHFRLAPEPGYPLAAPGVRTVLPLRNYQIPGTGLVLFRVDPSTGALTPAMDPGGQQVAGTVDAGGQSVTFAGVTRYSTLVGLLATALPVTIDIKPDDPANVINPKKNGKVQVALFGTPTFDVTRVNPATIRFSGAPVATNKKGLYLISAADLNSDGIADVVAEFDVDGLPLSAGDTRAVLEGLTPDGRLFRGTDGVQISK